MAAEGMNKQISREKNCDGEQILSSKLRSTKKISKSFNNTLLSYECHSKTYGSEQKKLIHTSWLFSHCLFWSSCEEEIIKFQAKVI